MTLTLAATQFEGLLKQLTELDRTQIEQVKSRLTFLSGQGKGGRSDPYLQMDADWLLNGLCLALERKGLLASRPPRSTLLRIAPGCIAGLETCAAYLLKGCNRKLTPPERMLLALNVGLAWIASEEQIGRTPGLRGMLLKLHDIPLMLSRSFPGYVEAGMLSWLVRTHKPSNREN